MANERIALDRTAAVALATPAFRHRPALGAFGISAASGTFLYACCSRELKLDRGLTPGRHSITFIAM
jgi:hypothetical protein